MYEWRTGRSCTFKNHLHLVFVTKYRRNVFTKEMLDMLEAIMSETCLQMDCELLEFGGEDDHVHIMLNVHPKVPVSVLAGKLKGKSSYKLKRAFWPQIKTKLWGNHFWSPSYCVVSCGGATLDVIKGYINNQRTPPSEKQVNQSLKITGKKRKD